MPKFKIWYDVGYGREEEEIEAEDDEEAEQQAYEVFAEACECRHSWGVAALEEPAEEPEEASPGEEEAP